MSAILQQQPELANVTLSHNNRTVLQALSDFLREAAVLEALHGRPH